ncbi:MAG: GNAT family N-acetyltransferase [Ruminococcaceae bacterium]|nr:GNAT family N-acetyltransferase [Oscillospiraceae bacterium]
MNITKQNIKGNKELCQKVKELYISAFPKVERLPWQILRLASCEKHSAIDAYFDGETFCGFTFSTEIDNIFFIMFFAVASEKRSMGYGSAILSKIKEENKGKTVVLNIEPIVAGAPNLKERESRLAFYQKNGFFDTGYYVREVGGVFTVMATEKTIDTAAYQKVFQALTLGLWKVRIEKKEKWKGKV